MDFRRHTCACVLQNPSLAHLPSLGSLALAVAALGFLSVSANPQVIIVFLPLGSSRLGLELPPSAIDFSFPCSRPLPRAVPQWLLTEAGAQPLTASPTGQTGKLRRWDGLNEAGRHFKETRPVIVWL